MPDDKTKVGEADRSRVSAGQDYEVRHLAEKYNNSAQEPKKVNEAGRHSRSASGPAPGHSCKH